MQKDQVDLTHMTIWIPDSKTDSGISEVPLTSIAASAVRDQIALSGSSQYSFPSEKKPGTYQKSLKKVWRTTLNKAGPSVDLCNTAESRRNSG